MYSKSKQPTELKFILNLSQNIKIIFFKNFSLKDYFHLCGFVPQISAILKKIAFLKLLRQYIHKYNQNKNIA